MRIALVDDDMRFLAQAVRVLELFLDHRKTQADIATFASAEDFLDASSKVEGVFDIYLLDVVLPKMNGIELAQHLRRSQPDAPIVFFTTSKDFALESYSVHAADYVVKPFRHEAFYRALDEAFRRLSVSRPRVLVLKTSEGLVNVALQDLVSAETCGHNIVVYTMDGRALTSRLPMQELWERLGGDARFIRVGRPFIVNLARTKNFTNGTLFLANGLKFPVPRRSHREVKEAFMQFYRG